MTFQNLLSDYLTWAKNTVVSLRVLNNEVGYSWMYKTIGFNHELTLENYQSFFDRTALNKEYATRYVQNKETVNKLPYAWYQNEINLIYSFHKCFAMRNHSRLQYYRNDLSQKGARTYAALNIGLGKFLFKKDLAEKNQ
jgi:hypothetical protein